MVSRPGCHRKGKCSGPRPKKPLPAGLQSGPITPGATHHRVVIPSQGGAKGAKGSIARIVEVDGETFFWSSTKHMMGIGDDYKAEIENIRPRARKVLKQRELQKEIKV